MATNLIKHQSVLARTWLTHLEALAWKKLGPGKDGCPAWQTRQPHLAGQPTNHINIIKLK